MLTVTLKRLAAALFLIASVFALYRKVMRLWWTYDDAWILHIGLVRPWTDAFTQSDVWPQKLFTPLLTATYELLLAVAGLDSDRWYRFELLLLAGAAIAIFAALRLYAKTLPALAGAFLFAAGPPLCSFATQLMVLHYLEAIILAALSLIAFVVAFRRMSNALNVLSAVLYFAAMLAKEIAIPLPVLLLLLPERSPRVRARHLLVHGLALAVYMIWRVHIVGGLFGGYGWAIAPREVPALVAMLPWKIVLACAGAGLGVGLYTVALMLLGAAQAMRTRRALVIALVALFFAIAPIAPVSKEMQRRYAITPWLWMSAAFAVGVSGLRGNARNALILAAAVGVVIANRQEWTTEYSHARRMSEEARAYVGLGADALLRAPAIPAGSMGEFRWLKEEHFKRQPGTGWFYDDLYLCGAASLAGKRVFEYAPAQRRVIEVTDRIPDFARAYCGSLRDNAPLRAEFHHRGEALFWRFGPYDDGRYDIVLGGGAQSFPVPREDGFRLAGVPGLSLRVRYQSPEGWVTYSPEIALDFARQPDFTWYR
ncbi:MAG TPA: hypothetical protein VF824_22310 [Thermoanaerobaculia bacterium]|jgi:hypothetical protein